MEVDMTVVFSVRIESDISKYLHPNDGINEKQHGNKQNDIGQCFEGLYKSPQQDSNSVSLSQQLDQTSSSEQSEKTHIDEVLL